MIREIEVSASPEVQRHLHRNPRVIEYYARVTVVFGAGTDVFVVKYDSSKPIPRIMGAEARDLGLPEIGGRPYNA